MRVPERPSALHRRLDPPHVVGVRVRPVKLADGRDDLARLREHCHDGALCEASGHVATHNATFQRRTREFGAALSALSPRGANALRALPFARLTGPVEALVVSEQELPDEVAAAQARRATCNTALVLHRAAMTRVVQRTARRCGHRWRCETTARSRCGATLRRCSTAPSAAAT
jgi:hypothetical protein